MGGLNSGEYTAGAFILPSLRSIMLRQALFSTCAVMSAQTLASDMAAANAALHARVHVHRDQVRGLYRKETCNRRNEIEIEYSVHSRITLVSVRCVASTRATCCWTILELWRSPSSSRIATLVAAFPSLPLQGQRKTAGAQPREHTAALQQDMGGSRTCRHLNVYGIELAQSLSCPLSAHCTA